MQCGSRWLVSKCERCRGAGSSKHHVKIKFYTWYFQENQMILNYEISECFLLCHMTRYAWPPWNLVAGFIPFVSMQDWRSGKGSAPVLLRGIRSWLSPASRTDLGCLFSLLTPCLSSYYFAFFCLFSSTSFPTFSIHSLLISSVILFVSLCPWDPGTRWLKCTNDSDTNLL